MESLVRLVSLALSPLSLQAALRWSLKSLEFKPVVAARPKHHVAGCRKVSSFSSGISLANGHLSTEWPTEANETLSTLAKKRLSPPDSHRAFDSRSSSPGIHLKTTLAR